MSHEKLIAVVGVSEEETAHLRLLMRKCTADLVNPWRWGGEGNADLLVVDLGSFAGQMARTRAQAAGMRCAVFSDVAAEDGSLVLRRPLTVANVVAVLNGVGGAAPRTAQIAPQGDDFYTLDIGEDAPEQSPAVASDAPFAPPAVALGLDELLRPQPLELREETPRPPLRVEPPEDAPRTPMRIEPRDDTARPPPAPAAASPAKSYPTRAAMLVDTEPRGVRAYLDEDLLRAPASFQLEGEAPLALDPKLRVVHTTRGLSALEPYCHANWRLCDWRPLTTLELNELRRQQPPMPYSRLIWLWTLVHSRGQLATHLDPGGTYRLTHWFEIERELGRYFRVASALLQPARLHEIAASAEAPMSEVFDLVNAYDSIGLIEWSPRARRGDDEPSGGLLQRLRRPFGRS